MVDRVNQRFGEYRLTRFLGRGSFGDVYLGEHVHEATLAAIKVLQVRLTKEDLKEFINEASTTFRLKHPHIVQLLDFGIGTDDTPFLVMDYAPNGTLRQKYPKGTRLPLDTIVSYVKQVAAALQYAHDKRLIHRDVKPENILLGPNNQVLLSDFGIASVAHSTRSLDLQSGGGTIPYMAPEQLQGKPRPASDQYALGIIVYEWLCGERPFNGTATEIAMQHMLTPPPPLRVKVPTILPDVEHEVMKTLAKEPKERFASVQAFATALEQASQSDSPTYVKPPAPVVQQPPMTTLPSQLKQPTVESTPPNQRLLSDSDRPTYVKPPTPVVQQPPMTTLPSQLPQSTVGTFPSGKQLSSSRGISRRTVVLGLAGLTVAGSGLTWLVFSRGLPFLSTASPNLGTTTAGSVSIPVGPIDIQTLIADAKQEGKLQAIGIPPEWADYKDMLNGYTTHYGIPIAYQAEAEYSSAQELEVFKNSIQHPHGDIGDVGFKFGPMAVQQGLVTPYIHSQWADIPDALKDASGNWCTEYYGAQAFVINTDLVKTPPASFQDLLNPAYKNLIGIDGDPRQANDAFLAVFSAALANGGSLDNIQSGIDFFAKLKRNGNFTTARSSVVNISNGQVAIAIMWDYLGLGFRDQLAGKPHVQVVIPSDGSIAGPYVSIVNKTAPHPYAARLWIEYIFSDEGQLFYLKGYAHPARYQALVSAGKVPADLAAKLPPAAQYANVKFPTTDQLTTASGIVTQNWGSQVLGQ